MDVMSMLILECDSTGGFIPIPSGNLIGHYDASTLGLNNNDPVASWKDLTVNANHLVQATGGSKPLFKTGILNGLPTVRFDGVDDFMSVDLTAFDTRNITMIIVRNASATNGIVSIAHPNTIDEEVGMYDSGTLGVVHQSSSGVATARAHQSPSPSGFFIESGRWGTSQLSLDIWNNAVLGTPSIVTFGSPGPYTNTPRTAYLAKRNETIPRFAAMDVAELLIYNAVISDLDRHTAEQVLAAKYGITIV